MNSKNSDIFSKALQEDLLETYKNCLYIPKDVLRHNMEKTKGLHFSCQACCGVLMQMFNFLIEYVHERTECTFIKGSDTKLSELLRDHKALLSFKGILTGWRVKEKGTS